MFDYEVECPKCGQPYVKEIEENNDEYEMECEDCKCRFSVYAEVQVDVIVNEVKEDGN